MSIEDKIVRVSIQLGRTVNLGNFESFHLRFGMEAEFAAGEFTDEQLEELRKKVYSEVQKQVVRIMP